MDNNKNNFFIPELQEKLNLLGQWSSLFISRYKITYLLILAIFIWGIFSFLGLPREVNPKVVIPYGSVLTLYPGAAPEEVETLITDKLEKKVQELEHVKKISSNSGLGYSSVFVEYDVGVDIEEQIQKLREKVSSVEKELPEGCESPEVSDFKTNNTPIMIINISGSYDFIELKEFAENIKDELEAIHNVSDVDIIGGLEREIEIKVDPLKLAAYNISLNQISSAISQSNVNFPGGNIKLDNKNYNIRFIGQFDTAEQIKNIVITYVGSSPLYIKDIAQVNDGYKDASSYSRMSSGLGTANPATRDSISLSVKKKEAGDIIKISRNIKKLIKDKKGVLYPEDLNVYISGDMAVYVEDELGTVINNSKAGLFLVIIVLFIFIGLRQAVTVSLIIPISLLIAFGFMKSFGITLNTISLFSLILAIGLLVDNAIVVVENIDRLRLKGVDPVRASIAGTNQIAPAVTSSALTTVAAFFPIILTSGIMGEFIRGIPLTVIFALAGSLFAALTITPVIAAKLLKEKREKTGPVNENMRKIKFVISVLLVFGLSMFAFQDTSGETAKFGFLSWFFGIGFSALIIYIRFSRARRGTADVHTSPIIKWYAGKLEWILQKKIRKISILAVMFIALVGALLLIPLGMLKIEMFTKTDYTRLYVNINAPKGTTLETTSEITREVEKRLFQVPEIESFVSNIGAVGADSLADFSFDSGGTPNYARIIIDLYEKKKRSRTSMEVAEDLEKRLKGIAGADIEVQELQNGPPSESPVVIRIKGKNLDFVKNTALDFARVLEGIPGVKNVKDGVEDGPPEIQVKIDKEKAAMLGIDDMTAALAIRNSIYGLSSTKYRQDQQEIDVVIRTSEDRIKAIQDLSNLYFTTRQNQQIPFSQVAKLEVTNGMNSIGHEDLKRIVTVSADVKTGVNVNETIQKFKEAVKDYQLPDGCSIDYGGEMEDINESFADMGKNMVLAILLVYIILVTQFNSFLQPFIILLSLPLAMIGVMPGLALTGNSFDFFAFLGVVALVGVCVNDAIVFIDYANYLRSKGQPITEALKNTGMTRFIPILATSITTIGGIMPLTLREPFFGSLGYALIFGLAMATILTLVVIPVVYSLLDRKEKEFRARAQQNNEVMTNSI